MNIVLTGALQVGKTTICGRVTGWAVQRGFRVRGFLTLPIWDASGQRLGLELLDLASFGPVDESFPAMSPWQAPRNACRRELARVDRDWGGPRVGPYHFDPATLRWGHDLVAEAIASGCDLLLVDEIGRLELEQGIGFHSLLPLLTDHPPARSLLVVRLNLLVAFQHAMPRFESTSIEATPLNRNSLPEALGLRLFSAQD